MRGLDIDIAPDAAIAAIGRTVREKRLSLEGDATVASTTSIKRQFCFIRKAWRRIVVRCGIQS
jgi:hypothetical protein